MLLGPALPLVGMAMSDKHKRQHACTNSSLIVWPLLLNCIVRKPILQGKIFSCKLFGVLCMLAQDAVHEM
jgi:hypothetical protein